MIDASTSSRGTLVLVVGPSGAGKDTLIRAARSELAGDPRIVFPPRAITRTACPGDEAHEPLDEAAFARRVEAGGFALHWGAHGHRYGIPAAIEGDLAAGKSVVVNASRAVVDTARRRFPPVAVVLVSAPADVLEGRLRRRRRENPEQMAARLARRAAFDLTGPDVHRIDNGGRVDEALKAFLAILESGAAGAMVEAAGK